MKKLHENASAAACPHDEVLDGQSSRLENRQQRAKSADAFIIVQGTKEKDLKDYHFAWELGSDLEEILPGNMPEPRGQGMIMRCLVDADHASDSITKRSRTGFVIYLNTAPICWYSKKQTTVETSSFGSKFVAMKQCTEYRRGLRYRMRMMGIPVLGPTYIYGDNQVSYTIPPSLSLL